MSTSDFTLSKAERISRKLVIDKLFTKGTSFVVYPIRVVYVTSTEEQEAQAAMMVSVSKKKFKRAVKRNYIKRRVKEAYRLNKHLLQIPESVGNISIAFIYLSGGFKSFDSLNQKMEEIMLQLNEKLCSENS
ncbi:ribonuclease P protein component [Parabacteroides sp. FAFU027]|uniref:ribonuclease P protein component n=1 Tax=Parabacteroides sp. FAFU027 TaxID=2922715 RepID=UPI001FAFC48D|nr:ribonuclease P protein component [Parabacteroides sp. FAFU027]